MDFLIYLNINWILKLKNLISKFQYFNGSVNGGQHNGSIAAFGPGDPGSNSGWSAAIKFKSIFDFFDFKIIYCQFIVALSYFKEQTQL